MSAEKYKDYSDEELENMRNVLNDPAIDEELRRRVFQRKQAEQHEERVNQSVETLTNSMENVEIHGLPLRALFIDENRFQLVSIWFKSVLSDNAATFSRELMAEQAENREKDGIIGALKQEVEARNGEIGQLKLENAQLEQYRQNAAEIIKEKDEEIERLNHKVDEQRQELALGVRGQIKVTNLDGGRELAEKIKANLTPVLSIDHVNSNTIRVVHPDGTPEDVNWLEKGKYRLLDEEEAGRFRAELAEEAARKAEAEHIAENPVPMGVETPDNFPTLPLEESKGVHGVQQETGDGDHGDQRADSEDGGVESLEARVAALEAAVFGAANTKGVA